MAAGSGWGGTISGGGNLDKSPQQLADMGIAVGGFNPVNAGQTEAEMGAAKNVDKALGFAAPALANMAAPGFGMLMGGAKTANNLMNGMPISEVAGGYLSGQINGFANKMSGGILGNAQMALGAAKSLGADVPSLNIGKEVVGALGMGPSGKSYGGAQQATAATSARDYVAQGIDSEGWTKRTGETT